MDNIEKNNIQNDPAEDCLVKIKQALFLAHESDKSREELLLKYISDLEWYLKIRRFLESETDRTKPGNLTVEFFENKKRYLELNEKYEKIGLQNSERFDLHALELFIQKVKSLAL